MTYSWPRDYRVLINLLNISAHRGYKVETHNLEVTGSSPVWSTLKIKHLQRFCRCFFFCRWPSSDLFEAKVTSRYPLKHWEIFCEFKKCFRIDYSENKEHYLKAASRKSKPDTEFKYEVWSFHAANHQEKPYLVDIWTAKTHKKA